jgi:hypothetical protein
MMASAAAAGLSSSFQTIKKNTAVVLQVLPYDERWVLYCKKNKTIQVDINEDDNNNGGCIRVGRSYGSFVKQSIHTHS